jgi:HD-like signal output (HDOD) protein
MNSHSENNKNIEDIVNLVNESELSSIRSVVSGIAQIINDPTSAVKDLKKLIEVDPPLTAKLLRVVNSPAYSLRREVSDITQAVILIGFEAVKELALNQKICEIFVGDETNDGYSRPSLWKHSVGVALFAKLICRREFRLRGENVYAAGLLHDLGIIVEDQFLQAQFREILAKRETDEKGISVAERQVLGFDHAEIGMALGDFWNLPEELVMGLGYHHNPDQTPKAHRKLVSILYVADRVCQDAGIGYRDQPIEDQDFFRKCLQELNIESSALDLILEDVKLEISKMEQNGVL